MTAPAPSRRVHGRVTFVVPTKDNARTIGACVSSSCAQSGDVEVVVVDNRSFDGTPELARAAGADVVVTAGPERSAQRNRGAALATGEFVAFVDSDMVLEEGVAEDIRVRFAADRRVGALVLPETAFGVGYLAGSRALEKRLYLGLASAEAARVFRADVLDAVGGYDELVAAFEDYEMADRVRERGWLIGRTVAGVRHDEGRVSLRRLWRKKRYYGSHWAASTGWDRGRLARLPVRPHTVLTDPLHVPGLIVLKTVDLGGIVFGHRTARRRSRRAAA